MVIRVKKLFLDDIRFPPDDSWEIVRSSKEAIEWLKRNGCPDYMSFDHDLGGDDTAMDVVHWMINKDLDDESFLPTTFTFTVHSANPVGRENIYSLLRRYMTYKRDAVTMEQL